MALSFWSNYWRQAPGKTKRWHSLVLPEPGAKLAPAPSPTGIPPTTGTASEYIAKFVASNFRQGQFFPIFHYQPLPEEKTLAIQDKTGIVGTLRSRPIGLFEDNPIYLIDLYCVRPDWRKAGIGSYLLVELRRLCALEGIHHFIFLKEDKPLNILGVEPIYSSLYSYRYIKGLTGNAQQLQTSHAYTLISSYLMLRPDTFTILNRQSINQNWFIYKTSDAWILALIQNSYQAFAKTPSTGPETLGWCTGWIESPTVSAEFRSKAAEEITASASHLFDWIWMDYKWTGNSTQFALDGQFHWYSYNWNTCLTPGQSYIIMT